MGGNLLNDSRVKHQQAASDQRQLPRNQEKQGAKYQRHTNIDDHAGESGACRADAPGLGGQGVKQFPGIVGVQVALAEENSHRSNSRLERGTPAALFDIFKDPIGNEWTLPFLLGFQIGSFSILVRHQREHLPGQTLLSWAHDRFEKSSDKYSVNVSRQQQGRI
jgi:hypothetical protein